MNDPLHRLLPLSPAVLHILLALSSEDRHGYGIMQEVLRQSEGKYKLGPGTLYDNLQKLLEQSIVREAAPRSSSTDSRRRYYRLTPFGRRLLATEVDRLESALRAARIHLKPRTERT